MIYLLRTFWVLTYIPVFLLESAAFVLGLVAYPLVEAMRYVRHGSCEGMTYVPDMMAVWLDKHYQALRKRIETFNKNKKL